MSEGLVCHGLCVERAGRPIVVDLDLQVPTGSVTVLLGANGAGKTTLMEALSGLIPVASGSVTFEGNDITRLRPVSRARAGMACVEQGRTLFRAMTVADNLRLARGGSADVEAVLSRFPELRPKLALKAGLLSGGEQQMLMLARALVGRPRLLLIDEMSLGLAPLIVRRMLPLIRGLAEEREIGVLLVEQFAVIALSVADTAYVLRRGRLTYNGPAAELAASPDQLDEAYFGRSSLHDSATESGS